MNNNIKDVYGLTPSQEGIYFQYFKNAETKTYQLYYLCSINKETDLDIIKKCVELLSVRHRVLKTAFTVLKSTGVIKQVILENRYPEFSIIRFDGKFSDNSLESILNKEINKPFNLQKDSLFRVIVVDFTDERFMLFHAHHIILDGWCLPVIIKDLQKYYTQLSDGISAEGLTAVIEKEAAMQTEYSQYVNWIKKQDTDECSLYWKNLVSDFLPSYIYGKENNKGLTNEEIVTFKTVLEAEISHKIEQFGKECRVSHNTVFETAFGIALQKYTGSDDVIFNKVISGRNTALKNIENTLGLFINTVPVRIRSDASKTLAGLIGETHTQGINAEKYGVLSLSQIYKFCDIASSAIDTLFVFENYYTGDIADFENGPISPKLVFFKEQTEFNLTLTVSKKNDTYVIGTSYSKNIYTEKEISDFIKGYIAILASFIDATIRIKDIPVPGEDLIRSFNATDHKYLIPEKSTIYSLFEKRATNNPEKVCLTTDNKKLTFGELLSLSESLDFNLRQITKNKKSVIAVIAERSLEMYVAIYGIMRGGNAYLPIDPEYPRDRIEYILKNSEAAAVVSQGKFVSSAGNLPYINMTAFIENAEKTEDMPPCNAAENDTAYVIYTSGSTGSPKGAKISHKSVINRILWMEDKYPIGENGVILQKTPYTFDVSVWELFWWGIVDGSLVASKPGEHFLPVKILEEVCKNKITHLHFVPSVFELFLNYLEMHREEIYKFNSIKYVFLSGESLTANLVQRFYNLYDIDKVTLHNLYGPTECAVDVTYYDCSVDETDPVPIGKPIYNTQLYVVNKHMMLCPVGVPGELCITGVNVGQGYICNNVLTAEKFIDNPFGEGKLYKTGDLAYWQKDGNIVFCGRKDNQIKLNGQRIELGEIESVICKISGITSVAVTVKKNNEKDVLIAFYTGKEYDASLIADSCSERLPRYMIPNTFVHLEALPLNQSGKLDRKRLSLTEIGISSEITDDSPINETEEYICDVFKKVLSIDTVSRNRSFFELGGTSLSMISVLCESKFESITAADFLKNSTPAGLALLIEQKNKVNYEYLQELYIPETYDSALILIPFAGGGAEAYSNLVNFLKKRKDDMAVYFVPYLHSSEECEKTAKEIAAVLKKKQIYIYSHCVGYAVALQILKRIEEENVTVKHYFAAASIPPKKNVNKNIWNNVPDKVLCSILVKAGSNLGMLDNETRKKMLEHFRKDTDFAAVSISRFTEKIKIPVTPIISKNDMFTRNYKQARALWLKYCNDVSAVEYIESMTHYFQTDNAHELTNIILRFIS